MSGQSHESMLTVKQVAQRLSVSQGLVYKLVRRGELACFRIGSAIRFCEEHLTDYLEREPRAAFKHLKL